MAEQIVTEEQARAAQRPWTGRFDKRAHNEAKCCAAVYDGGFGSHQCSKNPKHWYGSLGYCGLHDPETVRSKKVARYNAWRAQYDARDALGSAPGDR